jgi:hypothetical protein
MHLAAVLGLALSAACDPPRPGDIAYPSTGTIVVRVIDAQLGTPQLGVPITVVGNATISAESNKHGIATFARLSPGLYRIHISHAPDWYDTSDSAEVVRSSIVRVTLRPVFRGLWCTPDGVTLHK